jgi:hypothetical protein
VPAFERAGLTAEVKVMPPGESSAGPLEAAKTVAGQTGLAREAGPETMVLAGGREEVLDGLARTLEAALDAGARAVEVRVEAEGEADRFDGP